MTIVEISPDISGLDWRRINIKISLIKKGQVQKVLISHIDNSRLVYCYLHAMFASAISVTAADSIHASGSTSKRKQQKVDGGLDHSSLPQYVLRKLWAHSGDEVWFNRATPDDPDIENDPYVLPADDGRGIVFQLPRQREGNYTCRVHVNLANVMESERKTLIGKTSTVS